MAIDVETKDCTALSDSELAEMADICADGPAAYDIGLLSKQREEWVLVTRARNNGVLQGFSFCTLERIGGTPCVLIGMASIKRTAKRGDVLKAIMGQLLHLFEVPNRFGLPPLYTLHVWAWKDNSTGTFVNWHANVSCDHFRGQ